MTKTRTSLLCAAAFSLGGLAVGGTTVGLAQQDRGGDRPQLMRPDPGYIQQLSFADLVEDVSPAVVSIRTTQTVEPRGLGRMSGIPPEFERMFPQLRGRMGPQEPQERTGEGSGFFIDADGHVVTNNHVIDGADEIVVVLDSGKELIAELVGTDPLTDIAVLRVEPSGEQRYVQFSPDADLRVGDYVLAVGNPFGFGGTVTSGIVSAIGGDDRSGQYADFIQIDASINRGNSGGPTFDLRGNVVGVNTAIISPTGGNVGIGLAVPADTAAGVVAQILAEGQVTRGWLGVGIKDVDAVLASAVGLDEATGAIVNGVQEGSPADKAGIRDGDVILAFGGAPIDGATSLTRTVGATAPGERVEVRLIRDEKEETVTVRLERREADASTEAPARGEPEGDERMKDQLGVTFSALTPAWRQRMRLDDDVTGIVVTDVERGSDAADAGIRTGMVITEADNRELKSVADLERVVRMARERDKDAVLVRVVTRQGSDFRALPVAAG